ncbi:hypothetical protein N9934_01240 [Desulfosarcina sp.]|nr:hypothetical protein [Desulfosarcina sp.]
MRKQLILLIAILITLGLSYGDAYSRTEIYNVIDLGVGAAKDINQNGQVVGESDGINGFYWDSNSGRQNKDIKLFGINDIGETTGYSDVGILVGILWDSNTDEIFYMGQIDGDEALPNAINNYGQVTGRRYGDQGDQSVYIWDKQNGFNVIGLDKDGKDINDYEELVGHGGGSSIHIAWLWDASNGFQPLGVLNDGDSSAANAINNLTEVVGNSEFSSLTETHHAFLWSAETGMQDLGTLGYRPLLEDQSVAYDINIHGKIVGGSNATSSSEGVGGWVGFVYDAVNGMRDLNDLIPADSGWTIGRAFGINDLGQIVGQGYIDGLEGSRAFLLTPLTEPTIDAILDFFDESVEDGILEGDGPGKSANGRLNALRNMLEMAGDLIGVNDYEGACGQLAAALKKCDGESRPPDFVAGPATSDLYDMILELMAELGCE